MSTALIILVSLWIGAGIGVLVAGLCHAAKSDEEPHYHHDKQNPQSYYDAIAEHRPKAIRHFQHPV